MTVGNAPRPGEKTDRQHTVAGETKYVYWTDSDAAASLQKHWKQTERDVFLVRKAVCIPLSPQHDVCLVPPEAWRTYEFCRRQFSWYDRSPFAGQTLIVGGTPLPEISTAPETVITPCPEFQPPAFPTQNNLSRLIQSPAYQKIRPAAWEDIDSEDPRKHERWLRIMGQEGARFKDLFTWHCANHANFIDPRYTVTTENGAAPYAIGDTKTVCSSCLEFYNIIGRQHAMKYVVPCPGAVLFAGLKRNTYYQVKRKWSQAK